MGGKFYLIVDGKSKQETLKGVERSMCQTETSFGAVFDVASCVDTVRRTMSGGMGRGFERLAMPACEGMCHTVTQKPDVARLPLYDKTAGGFSRLPVVGGAIPQSADERFPPLHSPNRDVRLTFPYLRCP
jgi:hypothetical protein